MANRLPSVGGMLGLLLTGAGMLMLISIIVQFIQGFTGDAVLPTIIASIVVIVIGSYATRSRWRIPKA